MAKTDASLDDFAAEKHHDPLAAILLVWSRRILESPEGVRSIGSVLSTDFLGNSPRPVESRIVRPGERLSVRRLTFASQRSLGPAEFLEELHAALRDFSKIVTAEFQITRIGLDAESAPSGTAQVRYEFVGAGPGFHREQRVGVWKLEWHMVSASDYRMRGLVFGEEMRSRSTEPVFADATRRSFGANPSYAAQLMRGVDDWRTVLDAASGIDIYGHNGVSVGDIDGDGFEDLYVCQPAGLPNRLYRNRRDGTFEDITEGSGVGLLDNTACALFADFDNDGRQDLVVVRASGPLLFLNQGDGRFFPKPGAFQFAANPQGTFTGAAAADYDRDGWLDIYFCLYVYYQGTDQYKYPTPYYAAENGPPNFLMRNNRDGTFRDVTQAAGLNRNNTRFSFCCGWSDYDNDGWPDLYVVNDFGRKNLYHNNGDGTFNDLAAPAGVEDVGAGMSVSWLDYDNDGVPDLYAADMWTAAGERISMQETFKNQAPQPVQALYRKHAMGNSLFRGLDGGSFQDVTSSAGAGMGRWSWSSDAWDFDHDGFPDLYIANGMLSGPSRQDLNSFFWRQVVANSPDDAKASPDYERGWNAINELVRADRTWSGYERNVFYANNRDGTFSDVSGVVGMDFLEDGRAFALADFDHDGRQEVFLKNRTGPQLRLLSNVMAELPPSIAFRLRGVKSNRDAIGASVMVQTSRGRQTRMLQAGSGFLSQHSKEVFFGLGDAEGPIKATIRWPSGLVQEIRDIPPNRRVWIEEGASPSRIEPFHKRVTESTASVPIASEPLPGVVETWLLVPIFAPEFPALTALRGKPVLLYFGNPNARRDWHAVGLEVLTLSLDASDDVVNTYNLLYRYLFDRHRDLTSPTSFLIDERGEIVKVYQGPLNLEQVASDLKRIPQSPADRLAAALPFPGIAETYEFGRNYLSYGSAFFQRGYLESAEAFFRLALRDNPSSAEAQYGLGSVYLRQNSVAEARASFEASVKLDASYPDTRADAWNNLGLLAGRDGQTDEAIRCFEEALRVSPGHFVALENLGNAYRKKKQWDMARNLLEQAVAARPNDPEANYSLAMVYAQMDDAARAYDLLHRALQIRPAYPEALNNLGVLYLRTGKRDAAVSSLEECIRVAPAFDQSYLNLARVYKLEGNPGKARAVLQELLKRNPDHAQARQALEELP
jgi:tetratricopeptide (TPR) repeat protein